MLEQMNDFLIKINRLKDILNERIELARILCDEISGYEIRSNLEPKANVFYSQMETILSEMELKDKGDKDKFAYIEHLEDLVTFQENSLATLIQLHNSCFDRGLSRKKSSVVKLYISAADGGFPILRKEESPAIKARKRMYFVCGGPSLLVYVDKNDYRILGTFICESVKKDGYFSDEPGRILLEEVETFEPDIVLLLPNNATDFPSEILERLREISDAYLVARDGDPCSYNCNHIIKNLRIATQVDLFISVENEFAQNANRRGLSNVEYIPYFMNVPELKERAPRKTPGLRGGGDRGQRSVTDG